MSPPGPQPVRSGDGPRVVALGDSITVGVGDSVSPEARHGPGWAAHLAAAVGASSFTNLAANGARARDVAQGQLARALDLRPTLATVLAGGNDVLRSDFAPDDVAHHLAHVVTALAGAGVTVVMVRLPPVGLFELAPPPVRRVVRRRVMSVNAAVGTAVNAAVSAAAALSAGTGVAAGTGVVAGTTVSAPESAGAAGTATDRTAEDVVTPPAAGPAVLLDAAAGMARWGSPAWHVDRVHPSPHGHRHLALAAAQRLHSAGTPVGDPASWRARLPVAPPPPSRAHRLGWLVVEGVPWTVRRGRDLLPGLVRAVVTDLRDARRTDPALLSRQDRVPVRSLPVDRRHGPYRAGHRP